MSAYVPGEAEWRLALTPQPNALIVTAPDGREAFHVDREGVLTLGDGFGQTEAADALVAAIRQVLPEVELRVAPARPSEAEVEAAARGAAIHDDHDGCFERVDEYEALLAEFPDDYRSGDERPDSDYEACEWWRVRARAALVAAHTVAPTPPTDMVLAAALADAWDEGWAAQGEMSFDSDGKPMMHVPNPYRAARTAPTTTEGDPS